LAKLTGKDDKKLTDNEVIKENKLERGV